MSNRNTETEALLRSQGYVPTNEAAFLLNTNERSLRRRARGQERTFRQTHGILPAAKDDVNHLWFKVWNNSAEQARKGESSRRTVRRQATSGTLTTTTVNGRRFYSDVVQRNFRLI